MSTDPIAKPAESPAWVAAPRPWGRGDVVPVVAWLAGLLAFFWDAATLRKALFYFDITEINYPYRDFFAAEWRAGRFSRWMPGLYNGLPLFAESQAGYLHPLKFLYTFLPTWQALNLDTIGSIALTGLATYGWLRRHVGPAGAWAGATTFALSGFAWAHLIHTSMTNALVSVPLVFWAAEAAWDSGRLRGIALGGLALACQVFAGHLQDTILTLGALGLYALHRAATAPTWRAGAGVLGRALGLVVVGVAVAGVQWVPSKNLLDRSPREGGLTWEQITYGSWSPELLPTLVVREAYGTLPRDTDWLDGYYPYHEMNAYMGLIALCLAVVGAGAARDRWVGFWVILAGGRRGVHARPVHRPVRFHEPRPGDRQLADPGPIPPVGLAGRRGAGGRRRRPPGAAGAGPAPGGDRGGGGPRRRRAGHRRRAVHPGVDRLPALEHARAPGALPLARPRAGHRRRPDGGAGRAGLGNRRRRRALDPPRPPGRAGRGPARPDHGRPARVALVRRADDRPELLDEPARVRGEDPGRPGHDPGLRGGRAGRRRARVRVAPGRLLRGPRHPGLEPPAGLGPAVLDRPDAALPPAGS